MIDIETLAIAKKMSGGGSNPPKVIDDKIYIADKEIATVDYLNSLLETEALDNLEF